jgi:hypothetical protein
VQRVELDVRSVDPLRQRAREGALAGAAGADDRDAV